MSYEADQIKRLAELRQISLLEMCSRAKLSYSTLHAQIKNDRKIPFETIDSLSATMDVGLDFFSARGQKSGHFRDFDVGISEAKLLIDRMLSQLKEKGLRPDTDDFIDTVLSVNYNFDNMEWALPYIDFYEPSGVSEVSPTILAVGDKSLIRLLSGSADVSSFQRMMEGYDERVIRWISEDYSSIGTNQYRVTDHDLLIAATDGNIRVKYRRVLVGLKEWRGTENVVAVYSRQTGVELV